MGSLHAATEYKREQHCMYTSIYPGIREELAFDMD